ncbi:nuclease SbcCD subunit C [Paenibacillus marchantiophytorum]|uniref:Nuclease SbcCD subunit C n=1 Tax=Paenibacillus marchantiophytorum TaxID=1619310 RepID=A0ABQ2BQ99_9BACL|nr:SMC family ATPase [Paenibacillus marchantiophytorum]GGI43500.1 nuclease SbcCD subunit C [Paenibacillus marchantiophytorum]
MRPIQLQMSGLQSYREMQTIQFGQLVDAGVFGIFGPTGSGKSSILDAITLALYGKVERASGGTQAIMNHAEQTLFVSFTFELTNAICTERYHVERQFKRGTEMSINGTITRLLHIKEQETIVLADKAGEVNQQVQMILGLSMQDFTRAVVLPQGKFAEFLTLTGKDRRQMLQRLFHLEPYGDHLSAKVSSRVKETDSSVKQLAAEQMGLGDASEQALQEASERLAQAEEEAVRSRLHLAQQEANYEQHKQLFGWQQEKEKLEQDAQKQQEQELAIREKEQLLQKAEQADRVKPYLDQHSLALDDVRISGIQLEQMTTHQQAAEITHQTAAEKSEHAQQELAREEGPLMLRLDQLEQALVIEQELNQVQTQIQSARQQEGEAQSNIARLQAEIMKQEETKQKAILKQTDLKEKLKTVETSATTRQLLQGAVHEKKTFEQLQLQGAEAHKSKADKADAVAVLERSKQQVLALQEKLQSELAVWLKQSAQTGAEIQNQHKQFSEFIPNLQDVLDVQKRRMKLEERHALAAILANDLQEGELCPVCGSTEHPLSHAKGGQAAASEASKPDSAEDQIHQGERLFQLAKEHVFTHNQLLRKWGAVHQQALDMSSSSHSTTKEQASLSWEQVAAAATVPSVGSWADAQAGITLEVLLLQWKEMASFAQQQQSAFDELESVYARLHKDQVRYDQQLVQVNAQLEAAGNLWQEADGKLKLLQIALDDQRKRWQETYAELVWEQVEQQLDLLLAGERLADELRSRIEKSVPFLEQLTSTIEGLQRELLEQDRTALQLHERLLGLAQLAADKSRQLALRAPGAAVPQLIAEATSALARLRQLAQQTKLAHAQAQREQLQAAQRYSAAAEAAAAAARQLAQTERALHSALAENGFASREAAAAAALAPEQRRQWAQLAASQREREQALRAQLAQLAAKLQGRVLSAAEWALTQAQLSAAKAAAEAALEARATAAQGASELAARHTRWRELESRRLEQAGQLERLGKLQAVLKANAFVEYLAEEQLMQVSRAASERLGELTRRRYAIEVDSGGGFVIRDDANGGVKRPVSTLSGGETFLTSLALALALSAQIQLKGEYPLEFFFLDEGFGTLDQDLLDMVIGALEKLHTDSLAVGVISHVPELRARLTRKLIVHPAEPSGRGSRIVLEEL